MDELNLLLMEFRLRLGLPASLPLMDAQERLCDQLRGKLVLLIRRRPWLKRWWDTSVLAKAVTAHLFLKCFSGKTWRFTWAYLELSLKGFLSGEKPTIPPVDLLSAGAKEVPDSGDDWDLDVAGYAQAARRLAAEFRAGLDAIDQNLFDVWKANGNGHGWRSRFAQCHGVAPATVTRHLEDLRIRLGKQLREEQFEINDPNLFVEFLHWLEAPLKEEPEETPGARPESVLTYAVQQARLDARFAGQHEILDLMAAYGEGQPEEHILANLPGLPPHADHDVRCRVLEERLRQVHQAFADIAQVFRREEKARRYYERLQARKGSVGKVTRARPPWPAEKVALALRLQELARQGVSFDKLPECLNLRWEEVVTLILDIRSCK